MDWLYLLPRKTHTFDKQNSLHNIVNQFKQVKMWSVAKGSRVSWLFSLPCSQERLPEPCLVWICEMPANTNEWTTRIAAGDPNLQQSTRETPLHAIDTFPSVTLEARRREKSVTISFSYLTLDFILLKLLGRSGRGHSGCGLVSDSADLSTHTVWPCDTRFYGESQGLTVKGIISHGFWVTDRFLGFSSYFRAILHSKRFVAIGRHY